MYEPLAAVETLPFHHVEDSHRRHSRSIVYITNRRPSTRIVYESTERQRSYQTARSII